MWPVELAALHAATKNIINLTARTGVPIEHKVARAEAYLHAKFRLDPSNRLATVHERHRQHRQTEGRQRIDSIGRTVLQTVAQK